MLVHVKGKCGRFDATHHEVEILRRPPQEHVPQETAHHIAPRPFLPKEGSDSGEYNHLLPVKG
jgi:hypothetical protein